MSSLEPDGQHSTSTITINMSKEVMTHKLKSSCRLCLNERRSQVSLFERTSRRTNLTNAELVQLFTDILVDPRDGLPGMICTKCENMLHLILDFKIECQDSNETLMAIWEALNPKEEKYEDVKEDDTEMLEEEDEEEMYEANMSVEALELDEEEEAEIKTVVCKTDPDIGEVVEHETEELDPPQTNPEFVFESNDKQDDIILISVVDEDTANIQVSDEIWVDTRKPIRNKTSECHECGKRVEGPAKLIRHMRVHEREKKKALAASKPPKEDPSATLFKCGVCKKEFTLASRLKKHLETHLPMSMREKSYVCHCGKQYLDSGALRAHQLIAHTDNVPMYACEICNKEFTRKNYRDYHQRLHSSDKPHACDICDFRSAKKHNLIRHMLVHNNQYNFECDACGRKFKRKTGLHSHQKTHGCNENFMCPKCSRAYPNKHHLIAHLQSVHQIEMTSEEFDQISQESEQEVVTQVETNDDMNLLFAIEEITNDR